MSFHSLVPTVRRPWSRFALGVLTAGGLLVSSVTFSGCGDEEAAGQGPDQPPSLVRVAQLKKQPVSRKIVAVGSVTPVRTSIVASGANGVVQFLKASPLKDEVPDFDGKESEPSEGSEAGRVPSPSDPALPEGKSLADEEPPAEILPEIELGQFIEEGTVLSVLRMEATNNELAEARSRLREHEHKLKAARDIHPKELAHARAMVKVSEAVKKNAESTWQRTQALYNRGAATESELDDAREKWEAGVQSLIAAEENLAQVEAGLTIEQAQAARDAQAAHLAYLESEKAKRTTRAPFDGFIVREHTYVGQWLSKGDPVVTLARMDEVDVIVHVDQANIPYVRMGQSVSVTVNGADPSEWQGRIVHIVPRSDWEHGSRAFPVVVRIRNILKDVEVQVGGETEMRKVPVLKAGMMARVTIRGPEVETILAPKDALVRTTRGTYVFIFDATDSAAKFDPNVPTMGGVRQIPIEANLNLSDGEYISIRPADSMSATENPLEPGVWVVTEGGERFSAPVQDNVNALRRIEVKSGH